MHTPRKLKSDTAAEVGIGTMIVFIATILVAAIAAGVLISTSQKLQAKSTQTGNEATANVIGTLEVVSVQGVRSGTATTNLIDEVNVVVRLASGADPVDLNELVIEFSDGTGAPAMDASTNRSRSNPSRPARSAPARASSGRDSTASTRPLPAGERKSW